MNITGPFRDPSKAGQPKPWYLRVSIPKKNADGTLALHENGRPVLVRKRPYYPTKAAAEADRPVLAAQYGSAGAQVSGGILTRDQAAEFEAAKLVVSETDLVTVAKFWRQHHPLAAVAKLATYRDAYLAEARARLGDSCGPADMKVRVTAFLRVFGERIPGTVTRNEFLGWLLGLGVSPRGTRNYKQGVVHFFNWLVEKGVLAANPFAGIKRRALPRELAKEIVFLDLETVTRYLRRMEAFDPDMVAHEVIQLFSGVRADDEMANFDGKWVLPQTKEIVVPAEIAKKGRREVINTLEDNFWAWWTVYGRSGLVRPKNYRKRWERIRYLTTVMDEAEAVRLAALHIDELLAQDGVKKALKGWPWNARRRTFCTYHVAKNQSADKTALILRHRGEAATLHNSYRGLGVTQAQGVAYFDLLPSKVAAPILPARKPYVRRAQLQSKP